MKRTLQKSRVNLFIGGVSSLVFGMIILTNASLPLLSLIELLAAYLVLKGFTIGIGAWQTRKEESHWLFLLYYGVLNVLTGVIVLIYPQPTLLILGFIVSINLLVCGILQIMIAYHLRKEVKGIGWLIFSGIVATTAGAYIYVIPRISAAMILKLISVAGLLLGTYLIILSLTAVHWHKSVKKPGIQLQ